MSITGVKWFLGICKNKPVLPEGFNYSEAAGKWLTATKEGKEYMVSTDGLYLITGVISKGSPETVRLEDPFNPTIPFSR